MQHCEQSDSATIVWKGIPTENITAWQAACKRFMNWTDEDCEDWSNESLSQVWIIARCDCGDFFVM